MGVGLLTRGCVIEVPHRQNRGDAAGCLHSFPFVNTPGRVLWRMQLSPGCCVSVGDTSISSPYSAPAADNS